MRLSVAFGIDNLIKLRCYSEPKPPKRGDKSVTKRNTRQYQINKDLQIQLTHLKNMDEQVVDQLDIKPTIGYYYETVFRGDVINEIFRLAALRERGEGYGVPCKGGYPSTMTFKDVTNVLFPPLDLLNESKPPIAVNPDDRKSLLHNPTRLTPKAKSVLREVGSVLDADFKDNIYLLTLTLPSDGRKQFELLARYSGYLINRLHNQRQFRTISGLQYYYVWEFQKRGALHLHYAIAHADADVAHKAARIMRTQFYKVLSDIGTKHDIDMFASRSAPAGTWAKSPKKWQWSIDKITKSVTAYLSKYLSKGSTGFTETFYPARWWGCCKSLKATAKSYKVEVIITEIDNHLARTLYYQFADTFGCLEPALVVPFEHHIYNSLPITDPVTGDTTRIDSDSVFMSVLGVNFYYNPYTWLEDKYLDLREWFQSENNPLLSALESLQLSMQLSSELF